MSFDRQTQRQAWIDGLAQLREQGAITADDETTLIRHMDERLDAVQQELTALVPEYQRRVEADGQEAADAWIGERAREMGEREGADARRMVDSLAAVQATA
ncbi:hypothetical protein LDO26_14830 [Luteimonas sp. BDR2-5]|uniref:hypothetical protein n=1 Tax=Proluteimonas luteida TaxID=2878685 RepID=UPI001E6328EF|nr:hypothetical protein [Luteimonas sp. BDR2-5]MCD9029467.1 hypothetical protein [Luteimonas sp. BDR2-5]